MGSLLCERSEQATESKLKFDFGLLRGTERNIFSTYVLFQLTGMPHFFLTSDSKETVLSVNRTGGLCLTNGTMQLDQVYKYQHIAWKFIGKSKALE